LESVVDDLSFSYGIQVDLPQVEDVLGKVQRLEPVGIAARTLQECLLVQLDTLPEDIPGRENAIDILQRCYKDFTMKHFRRIMQRLDLDEHELKESYELIQHLDPKPGEGEVGSGQNYIIPDFIIERVDDEFIISLNRRNAPQLRISSKYQNMLGELAAERKNGKLSDIDAETRQFLKTKLDSARWFILSIQQRRQTMLKVMQAILQLQEPFFRHGAGHLRPMILKDVAEQIDMDISTVSRVVNGKYVQTESGVYELKYFFSEGVATEFGEDVSNREIKALIEKIIESENKHRPLSDQKIADLLREQGFRIARRTVSKYREQLGLPVARLRKEILPGSGTR
jgi:RNA polymerase sigma-54 factor